MLIEQSHSQNWCSYNAAKESGPTKALQWHKVGGEELDVSCD